MILIIFRLTRINLHYNKLMGLKIDLKAICLRHPRLNCIIIKKIIRIKVF